MSMTLEYTKVSHKVSITLEPQLSIEIQSQLIKHNKLLRRILDVGKANTYNYS